MPAHAHEVPGERGSPFDGPDAEPTPMVAVAPAAPRTGSWKHAPGGRPAEAAQLHEGLYDGPPARESRREDAKRAVDHREERYVGTGVAIPDAAEGNAPLLRAQGRAYRWDEGGHRDARTGMRHTEHDDTRYRTSAPAHRGEVRTSEFVRATADASPLGVKASRSRESGIVEETLDVAAVRLAAEKEIGEKLKVAGSDKERRRLEDARKRVSAATGDEGLARAIGDAGVLVEPKYRASGGVVRTEKADRDLSFWKGAMKRSHSSATTVHGDGGSTTTTGESVDQTLDLGKGTFAQTTARPGMERTTDAATGAERTTGTAETTDVQVGDGRAKLSRGERRTDVTTDRNGEPVSGHVDARKQGVGAVAGDNGVGLLVDRERRSERTVDGRTSATTTSSSASFTDKGMGATGGVTSGGNGKLAKTEHKAVGDGSFTVDIVPVPGTQLYEVVCTLKLGGTLGSAVGTRDQKTKPGAVEADRTTGSGSLGVSGSASLSYAHRMDADEARAYLDDAHAAAAGGKPAGALPEISMLARMRAFADEASVGRGPGMFREIAGGDASGMAAGDHLDLVTTFGIDAKVGGAHGTSKQASGVDAGASGSWTRSLQVKRLEARGSRKDLIEITVSFTETGKLSGKATTAAAGVPIAASAAVSGSSGEGRSFVLSAASPDYAGQFDALSKVTSPEELEELAAGPLARLRHVDTHDDATANEATGALGVLLLSGGLGTSHRTSTSETTRREEGGVEGDFSGQRSWSASALAGGAAVARHGETDAARTTVDDRGTSLSVTHTEDETDLGRTLAGAADTVKGWFGLDQADPTVKGMIRGAVARTPGARAKELVEKTYQREETLEVSPADVATLVARAGDGRRWLGCCVHPGALEWWSTLGEVLRDPEPDEALVEEAGQARAEALVRARAIARFTAKTGGPGRDALEHALRRWGETGAGEGSAPKLGAELEWPPDLAGTHKRFDQARARVGALPAALEGQPGGTKTAEGLVQPLIHDLCAIYAEIAAAEGFRRPRAKAEMLDAVNRMKEDVAAMREAARDGTCAAGAGPRPATADQAARRCVDLSMELRHFRAEEQMAYERVREAVAAGHGGRVEALQLLDEVGDLHDFWRDKIGELRAAYAAAGTPPELWVIGQSDRHDDRRRDCEPDVATRTRLHVQASGGDIRERSQ